MCGFSVAVIGSKLLFSRACFGCLIRAGLSSSSDSAAAISVIQVANELNHSQVYACYGLAMAYAEIDALDLALGAMRTCLHLSDQSDPFRDKANRGLKTLADAGVGCLKAVSYGLIRATPPKLPIHRVLSFWVAIEKIMLANRPSRVVITSKPGPCSEKLASPSLVPIHNLP